MNEKDLALFQEFLEFKKYKESLERQESLETLERQEKQETKKKSFPKAKAKTSTRTPKGNGSVYCLGKNRKKPWAFRVTVGVDEVTGQQKRILIGTYETREQAETVRARYMLERKGVSVGGSTETVVQNVPTVKQIFDILWEEKIKYKSKSTQTNYKSQFKKFENIWGLSVDKVTLSVLESEFSKICSSTSKTTSKLNHVIISQICEYALVHDLVQKNVATSLDLNKFYYEGDVVVVERKRTVFTKEEILKIDNLKTKESKMIMILLYTGMRPIELATMKKADVNLEEGYMRGGAKTENGKNRIIPIHPHIAPYVKEFMQTKGELLLFDTNYKKPKAKLEKEWQKLREELNLNHELYDTRHTFSTIAKICGVSDYGRKKIMGHSCQDLTDDVYTHAPISYLKTEVEKIGVPTQLDI